MRTLGRVVGILGLGVSLALVGGCSSAPEPASEQSAASDLTQAKLSKLKDPLLENIRTSFDAATKGEKSDFYGYAAAFSWGTEHDISNGLSDEQVDYLASSLLDSNHREGSDRLPYGMDFHAASIAKDAAVAESELRLPKGAKSDAVDQAIRAAAAAGRTVARYEAKAKGATGVRTAGAVFVVDLKNREALVVYGRRGAAPLSFDCHVTTLHSYEWEEALSKEEYPDVSAYEIPLTGDVVLDIGVNGSLSNTDAVADGEDYTVSLTKVGKTVEIVAKGDYFRGKLVVEGKKAVVYGDRDGNGRPNKAATLACD